MTTKRPVHYAASGHGALAFDCFYRELQAHVAGYKEERVEIPEGFTTKRTNTVPTPRRHTDLRWVTCPECWGEIARMAQGALATVEGKT
jgi:hypothetical protein